MSSTKYYLSEDRYLNMIYVLYANLINANIKFTKIIAIERGGVPIAKQLSRLLEVPYYSMGVSFYDGEKRRDVPIVKAMNVTLNPWDVCLVVDDLIDTGDTMRFVTNMIKNYKATYKVATIYQKDGSNFNADFYVEKTDKWVVFHYETASGYDAVGNNG